MWAGHGDHARKLMMMAGLLGVMLGWALEPQAARGAIPGKPQHAANPGRATGMLESAPPVFTRNQGQWSDSAILFALSGTGLNVGLTGTSLRFQLFQAGQPDKTPSLQQSRHDFQIFLDGACPVQPEGFARSGQFFNYRCGERASWHEGVPAFESVRYGGLYPGVDMIVSGRQGGIKYEFHVAPGADWKQIRMRYEGLGGLKLREDGSLELMPAEGWAPLVDGAPFIYQEAGGERQRIAGRFRLLNECTVAFEVTGDYDTAKPLVIDPDLAWRTCLGGAAEDRAYAIARDAAGNFLVTGKTTSRGWVSGGYNTVLDRGAVYDYDADAFVVKLSPTGTPLWSTYLGGPREDYGKGIAADAAGNIYVTGATYSDGWVSGGFDVYFGGIRDGFVVKLSPSGQHLWSTCLGGLEEDEASAIAVDAAGNACVTGWTNSPGWVHGGYDTTYTGQTDGFVAKLAPDGNCSWSTYLGGVMDDSGADLALDSAGNLCVTGITHSSGWIRDSLHANPVHASNSFVLKLAPAGQLLWSTCLGDQGLMDGYIVSQGLTLDPTDNIYVTGRTTLAGWAVGGFNTVKNGDSNVEDAFVSKLSGTGQRLWSTYLGGDADDCGYALAVDRQGNINVAGSTEDNRWVRGGFIGRQTAGTAGFVMQLTSQGAFHWASDFSGEVWDLLVDSSTDDLYVAGSISGGWLPGGDPFGSVDAFLARLNHTDRISTGSLCVTLSPPGAVAAGAQWRRAGTTAWHDSGTTETGITTGYYDLEFKPVSGWVVLSPTLTISITSGQTTSIIDEPGHYLQGGTLQVTLGPAQALAADAQWRLRGIYYTSPWYDSNTSITLIPGSYTLECKPIPDWLTPASRQVTFRAGQTTATTALYRLPQADLSWSTYLGEPTAYTAGYSSVYGLCTDGQGNIYATGYTSAAGWVSGGYDTIINGNDAFAIKLSPEGTPVWSTYLGGFSDDFGQAIAVDHAGNVCVAGTTYYGGWITKGYDTTYGGSEDGFIVKLSPAGQYLWGTYLGGSGLDECYGIAVDGSDAIYATGVTGSSGWLAGGFNTTLGGGGDAFIVKLSAAGQHLWSTCLGGAKAEWGYGIAIDHAGNACITGTTYSSGWVAGGYDVSFGNASDPAPGSDAFVAKVSGAGQFLWSSYLGGLSDDQGRGIAVDSADNICVVGWTPVGDWTSGGQINPRNGCDDLFVARLSPAGAHLWSECLGGLDNDEGHGIVVNSRDEIFVTGVTASAYWVQGGNETYNSYFRDAFLAKLMPDGRQSWSSYLGGSNDDYAYGVAVVPSGDLFVGGKTMSSDWASGGYNTTFTNMTDGFIAKFHELDTTTTRGGTLAVTITPPEAVAAGAQWQRAGTSRWNDSGTTSTNAPTGTYSVEFKSISGWIRPPTQTVTVSNGGATTATAGYVRQTGSLIVTLTPPEAVAAGAKWRRVGTIAWHDSGTTEAGVPVGYADVEFMQLPGWGQVNKTTVQITPTVPATLSMPYHVATGTLDFHIEPMAVLDAGASWRRVGVSNWQWRYYQDRDLPTGSYEVEFKDVAGWVTPPRQTVLVLGDQVNVGTAVYVRQTGALQVAITPPAAAAAGVMWRRVGAVRWSPSGATEPDIIPGSYQVEFSPAPGWSKPATQGVTINYLQTTVLSVADLPSRAELSWSSYLGGSSEDSGKRVAMDKQGNVYVAGYTRSADWITSDSAGYRGGYGDAFVAKLDSAGKLVWSTYLGGNKFDEAHGIAVDNTGNVYVCGITDSAGWFTGGFDTTLADSYNGDGFVLKLSPEGKVLWGSYLGGGSGESANDLALDGAGNICVTGITFSSGWFSGGYNPIWHGGRDAFVVKLTAVGQLLWGTYLGGGGDEIATGVAVDGAGNIYATGKTDSSGWVAGGWQTAFHSGQSGSYDGYVVKLSPGGQHLWSTYLGGSNDDSGEAIAVDTLGNSCVVGTTLSSGWVSEGTANPSIQNGYQEAFAVRLSAAGQHLWSAYLGGDRSDFATGVAMDARSNAYITGYTCSSGWLKSDLGASYDSPGGGDAFVIKLSPGCSQLWGMYLGGTSNDKGAGIATDGSGHICVTGETESLAWTVGGYDASYGYSTDGFVAYVRETGVADPAGSLRVTIAPAQAAASGAKWRRVGSTAWQDSDATEANVPAGTWWVEFQPGGNWQAPTMMEITITQGQLTKVSVTCTRNAVDENDWMKY